MDRVAPPPDLGLQNEPDDVLAQPRAAESHAEQESQLQAAVLRTLAYADVFDFPLSAGEAHRYLIEVPASLAAVQAALESLTPRLVSACGAWYTLRGREEVALTRQRRSASAKRAWPIARAYARTLAHLPFVRLVAITGGLAMDNVLDDADDIDLLVVTTPGRLWLCRALVVGVVRMAALRGQRLCPNYLITERALSLEERNLFTAHELTQMVPLVGLATYAHMRALNAWSSSYLPNAEGPPRNGWSVTRPSRLAPRLERALSGRLGSRLETWEMRRKVRRLSTQTGAGAETLFNADQCKGHFDHHGEHTLTRFSQRLRRLGGAAE